MSKRSCTFVAWTKEDKAKAMVAVNSGLPLSTRAAEELVKTLDCVRTVVAAQQYCKHQRLKLGIARLRGANGAWSPEDNVKVMEVVNCGLPSTTWIVEALVKTLDPGHGYDATMKRCQRDRSASLAFIQVERKRKSALCL